MHVLLLDDDVIFTRLFKIAAEKVGISVYFFDNLEDFRDGQREAPRHYDAVIVDVFLDNNRVSDFVSELQFAPIIVASRTTRWDASALNFSPNVRACLYKRHGVQPVIDALRVPAKINLG